MKSSSILLVDDDSAFREVMADELCRLGYQVNTVGSGEEAIRQVLAEEPDIMLLDLRLPGISGLEALTTIHAQSPATEVIMMTGHGSIDTAIESIRIGAFDYVVKPCPLDELDVRIQRALERRNLRQRASILERGLTPPDLGSSFVGDSPEFRRLLSMTERIAPSDATVLITGETGAGKERVAKMIHSRSARASRPFVVVECAALQESLLQSELFGHERGAFTGADKAKPGLFEVAHGGTIFLDEIGEISPTVQTKLLRVLDSSTFRHVGGTKEIRVDVRVLTATNRDIPAMVRQGHFREDLYYRLSTFHVEVPPLRARSGDVELLAQHFVTALNERFGSRKAISVEALELLHRHHWPGNVRELLHVMEAALVLCQGPCVLPEHLPETLRTSAARQAAQPAHEPDKSLRTLEEQERIHIRSALQASNGHRGNAARILGISERNLYRKLREHNLLSS
ncbi:MAG TPA: sigma-54 dependent transcriptional regulator [Candidatus Angelobacter sp.]|jgi:DNA-binding NtrC family response regulator|nr:sigma-54 dependent transcriptional regulator [Candidatus Angelobacter sp.]